MGDLVVYFIMIGILGALIVFINLKPLSPESVKKLANKRRQKYIKKYFVFIENRSLEVDKNFKKRMNPNGTFYKIEEELYSFPFIASALLKWKKHEWIIVGFENNKKINLIWVNKGFDRSSVNLYLETKEIIQTSKEIGATTVLFFHNHPNSNPRYYDCTQPSKQDLKSAKTLAEELNAHGINSLEFIAERGVPYKYYSSYTENFYSINEIINDIEEKNGISIVGNFLLRCESLLSWSF